MMEAHASKQSQSHKLRTRLAEAGFTHGDSARVHLSDVELRHGQKGPRAYFCRIGPIEVIEELEEGDGKALPNKAELRDLVFPEEGFHRVENVVVRTNGRMLVEADEKTEIKTAGICARIGRFFRRLVSIHSSGPVRGPW